MVLSRFYCVALAAVIGASLLSPKVSRADDAANPKYAAWASFKPGSFSTVEADMDVQGSKIHISMTKTLISVDTNKVVVETRSTVRMMGQDHDSPKTTEIISAKQNPEEIKQTGEKDVAAMGKTFKCKVYEAKGNTDIAPARGAPTNVDDMKATVYASSDVPGGLVRLETIGNGGKDLTFVLTAMEAK